MKENQMVIGNRNIGQMYFSIWFFVIFFFLSISSSCRERNQFILTVSTLLMVLEMFTGHFKHVAMDLLFISVFARLLALFLE